LHAVNLQARSTVRGVATKKKWQCPLKNSLLRYLAVVYFFPSKTKQKQKQKRKNDRGKCLGLPGTGYGSDRANCLDRLFFFFFFLFIKLRPTITHNEKKKTRKNEKKQKTKWPGEPLQLSQLQRPP